MGFGEYDGTLDNAQKRIGEFAGLRCLLVGALIGDWLEFLREVVRKRLEQAVVFSRKSIFGNPAILAACLPCRSVPAARKPSSIPHPLRAALHRVDQEIQHMLENARLLAKAA
jgi:hypothetical protein